ncbi:hypothetical protein VNO77_24369 [Canavalia gladiata]|uniref:Transcriptional corepressor LEUNIG n=1 Tax=Canavalia gladiata TaxID=3824 RepID=A0AAN9QCJ9_CANGL
MVRGVYYSRKSIAPSPAAPLKCKRIRIIKWRERFRSKIGGERVLELLNVDNNNENANVNENDNLNDNNGDLCWEKHISICCRMESTIDQKYALLAKLDTTKFEINISQFERVEIEYPTVKTEKLMMAVPEGNFNFLSLCSGKHNTVSDAVTIAIHRHSFYAGFRQDQIFSRSRVLVLGFSLMLSSPVFLHPPSIHSSVRCKACAFSVDLRLSVDSLLHLTSSFLFSLGSFQFGVLCMLDAYIYDYFMKRKLHASASAFFAEGNISTDPEVITAPHGFLLEWWTVFWDVYMSRMGHHHTDAAAFYHKIQQRKAREMDRRLEEEIYNTSQNQQMEMPLLSQRHAQQQQCIGGTQLDCGDAIYPMSNDPFTRQNWATSNARATKLNEGSLKLPLRKDALDYDIIKQKVDDNVGQLLDPNIVAATAGGQATGQTLLSAPSILLGNMQQIPNPNQKLPGLTHDINNDMNAMMRSQTVESDGSLIGCHGPNQDGSNLTLKGWPLAGLDQLPSGFLQQYDLAQSPQSFNQLSLQQQHTLQTHSLASLNDFENRRLGMHLNSQNIGLGKDRQSNTVGDLIPNNGVPAQVGSPILPQSDSDMLLKQQIQESSQLLQQYRQHPLSSQQSQGLQQQEKIGPESMTVHGGVSSSLKGNDQASKSQIRRKRKSATSSGPANSSGTANTAGPSTSSPSTPSTQTPGDMTAGSTLQQNVPSSKSLLVFRTNGVGSLTTAQNQLPESEHFVGDESLGENVEAFLSLDTVPTKKLGKELSLEEIKHIMASSCKIECCHFSSDGKLLATAGHDNKASLWCTELFNLKCTLEEHSEWITDVQFCPSLLRVATSSADKTVKVWDVDNPSYSLRTFTGHAKTVMSLDFHPSQDDIIFSSDISETRYWSIKNGSCAGVFKGGATQLRFQPCLGRFLAAAADNLVSIFDVETMSCLSKLTGHKNLVQSICWNFSGKYLASLSDDLARVWIVGSNGKADCIKSLNLSGNKFNTCAFHPFNSMLVIGSHKNIELWDFMENKLSSLPAHDNAVSSLAVSKVSGLIASTSHDKDFKIWK